ncbi:MAG TPA: DUF805 domain-containing protein [Acidobacteriaceae bacterium]|nr:DUF805 domain-containing protein [Acidobacteriaceae bacterium]
MDAYMAVLQKFADFGGRSSRREYWMFVLVNFLISLAIAIAAKVVGIFAILRLLYSLAVLIPGIAVGVRRMHDTGKSGWLLLVSFTIIGIPLVIWWLATAGDPGDNQYGPAPVDGTPAFA